MVSSSELSVEPWRFSMRSREACRRASAPSMPPAVLVSGSEPVVISSAGSRNAPLSLSGEGFAGTVRIGSLVARAGPLLTEPVVK